VTAVAWGGGGDLLATSGDLDGTVKLWDVRNTSKPVLAVELPVGHEFAKAAHAMGTPPRRQALGTSPLQNSARGNASQKSPGAQKSPLQPGRHGGGSVRRHGISSLAFDSTGSRLLVSSLDNRLYLYEGIQAAWPWTRPSRAFSGHICAGSFYIQAGFSPDGRHVVSGSKDGNVYVWEADGSGTPLVVLRGHTKEACSVAWSCNDLGTLASCSDDATVKVWQVNRRRDERLGPSPILLSGKRRRPDATAWAPSSVERKSTFFTTPLSRSPRKSPRSLSLSPLKKKQEQGTPGGTRPAGQRSSARSILEFFTRAAKDADKDADDKENVPSPAKGKAPQ